MKKQIGIWLDLKEAILITVNSKESKMEKIQSEIEDFKVKGGHRSKTPYSTMEVASDIKYLERKNNQLEKFYKHIMNKVKDVDELFIMGPGEVKIGLRKRIERTKSFKPIIKGFEVVDSVTDNQKIAKTKSFFAIK